MKKCIAALAGDGIGPEIMKEGRKVLDAVAKKFGHTFEYKEALVGGCAYDKYDHPLPDETKKYVIVQMLSILARWGGRNGRTSLQN